MHNVNIVYVYKSSSKHTSTFSKNKKFLHATAAYLANFLNATNNSICTPSAIIVVTNTRNIRTNH